MKIEAFTILVQANAFDVYLVFFPFWIHDEFFHFNL